jgi:hypothetical protein
MYDGRDRYNNCIPVPAQILEKCDGVLQTRIVMLDIAQRPYRDLIETFRHNDNGMTRE